MFLACGVRDAVAQAAGDSVRVRLLTSTDWYAGRLVHRDSTALILRAGLRDTSYTRQDVRQFDVWKHDNASTTILLSGAGGAAIWALSPPMFNNGQTITGSVDGDAVVGGLIGLLFGVAAGAMHPGSWHHGAV
jgi:hypothetical protein